MAIVHRLPNASIFKNTLIRFKTAVFCLVGLYALVVQCQ